MAAHSHLPLCKTYIPLKNKMVNYVYHFDWHFRRDWLSRWICQDVGVVSCSTCSGEQSWMSKIKPHLDIVGVVTFRTLDRQGYLQRWIVFASAIRETNLEPVMQMEMLPFGKLQTHRNRFLWVIFLSWLKFRVVHNVTNYLIAELPVPFKTNQWLCFSREQFQSILHSRSQCRWKERSTLGHFVATKTCNGDVLNLFSLPLTSIIIFTFFAHRSRGSHSTKMVLRP